VPKSDKNKHNLLVAQKVHRKVSNSGGEIFLMGCAGLGLKNWKIAGNEAIFQKL